MKDRRIAFLTKQLLSGLQREWTIEEMAQTVELSTSQLQKDFKTHTGMSPLQYLRDLRLEESRRLLKNSFKRIKEIAALVGLPDQSHFVRDFKKKYGCTPSEYRNGLSEKGQPDEK